MYRPIGITNGNETIIAQRLAKVAGRYADFWVPACWAGFFFDLFVIVTLFAFKKQRKFPACIVGLFCCVDSMHFLRELVKASPIPSVNERFYWTPTQTDCAVVYLWVPWVEAADFVLVLTLAIALYRTIVFKEDVSYKAKKSFFLTFLVVFIVYPFVYAIFVGGVVTGTGGYDLRESSCAPVKNAASIIGIAQCFTVLCILVVFMSISLRHPLYVVIGDGQPAEEIYIWDVFRANASNSTENSKAWVIIRFVLIIILQTAPRIAFNAYYLTLAVDTHISAAGLNSAGWAGDIIPIACYYMNALVVLWANKSLQEYLFGSCISGASDKNSSVGEGSFQEKSQKRENFELKAIQGSVEIDASV